MTPANDNRPTQFKVGTTYGVRSICDYDTIFKFTIVGRTDKSVKVDYHGKVTTRRIRYTDGMVETIDPMGRYSMSPVLTADKELQ